jgi:hypothetical protein
MIGIPEMYSAKCRLTPYGIEGYAVEKKYQEPNGHLKSKHGQ